MGDATEMVPFDGLDGTKRMVRWDFNAAMMAEKLLREDGRDPAECNLLAGGVAWDVTLVVIMTYAVLAAGDEAMGKEHRLTLKQVATKMDQRNLPKCVKMLKDIRMANDPPEKKRATPKKRADKKRGN